MAPGCVLRVPSGDQLRLQCGTSHVFGRVDLDPQTDLAGRAQVSRRHCRVLLTDDGAAVLSTLSKCNPTAIVRSGRTTMLLPGGCAVLCLGGTARLIMDPSVSNQSYELELVDIGDSRCESESSAAQVRCCKHSWCHCMPAAGGHID